MRLRRFFYLGYSMPQQVPFSRGSRRNARGGARIGDLFSADQLHRLRASLHEERVLVRGDVIWLTLPQTLWHKLNGDNNGYKRRPFLVLDREIRYTADYMNVCKTPVSILGVDLSQNPDLIPGRPYVDFHIPGSRRLSFAWFDTIRSTDLTNVQLQPPVYRLSPKELEQAHAGLDRVLRPTVTLNPFAFFRERFAAGSTCFLAAKGIEDSSALVILEHAAFEKKDGPIVQQLRPPYLVATFKKAGAELAKREGGGSALDAVNILHVNGNALSNPGKVRNAAKAHEILNAIREKAGLDPLPVPSLKDYARQALGRLKTWVVKGINSDVTRPPPPLIASKDEVLDY